MGQAPYVAGGGCKEPHGDGHGSAQWGWEWRQGVRRGVAHELVVQKMKDD